MGPPRPLPLRPAPILAPDVSHAADVVPGLVSGSTFGLLQRCAIMKTIATRKAVLFAFPGCHLRQLYIRKGSYFS